MLSRCQDGLLEGKSSVEIRDQQTHSTTTTTTRNGWGTFSHLDGIVTDKAYNSVVLERQFGAFRAQKLHNSGELARDKIAASGRLALSLQMRHDSQYNEHGMKLFGVGNSQLLLIIQREVCNEVSLLSLSPSNFHEDSVTSSFACINIEHRDKASFLLEFKIIQTGASCTC